MLLLKRICAWLARKKIPEPINSDLPPAIQRDLGISVTRVRLPSGTELMIVERVKYDD